VAETWKPITGHTGYEVSDAGRVRSYRAVNGQPPPIEPRILKLGSARRGYLTIRLGRIDGRLTKTHKVHRLVLTAFVGPAPAGCIACHNNGITSDNRLENLRWDTPTANNRDTIRHGTHRHAGHGETHPRATLTNTQAAMVKTMLAGGMSSLQISQLLHVSRKTINNVRCGHSYKHVDPAAHDAAIVELTGGGE
jgi:hypothetical protein